MVIGGLGSRAIEAPGTAGMYLVIERNIELLVALVTTRNAG